MSDTALAEYEVLSEEARGAFRADLSDQDFGRLALEIHAFQRRWNAPYAKWCASLPPLSTWQEIPAVPQAMFKEFRLSCFPPQQTKKTFRTSGTTAETRGEHHLLDTTLYEAAVLAGWKALGMDAKYSVFLAPSPIDAPDSSLSHMFATLAAAASGRGFGEGFFFCDAGGKLHTDRIKSFFYGFLERNETVGIFGTALSFLNFFEWLGERRIVLKKGSFAVETGGFKGSGRAIVKPELYARFERHLRLPPARVWNEYGMCELGSQFYARGLGQPHRGGSWVRAQVISPKTGREVADGESGVLRLFDLANVGSVLAIQTADLAVRRGHDFELIGRDPAAIPRGCSRAADEAMRSAPKQTARIRGEKKSALARTAMLGTTRERAAVLAHAAEAFPFLGEVTAESLLALVRLELGHEEALDRFVPYGRALARAVAVRQILHILSANTPAAALQTLIRGLLLGARNRCKLPSVGLPEVQQFVARLPEAWRPAVELSTALSDAWLREADAVVVFGSDATIAHFRAQLQPHQVFVPHGHKLSFGLVLDDPSLESPAGAARDASIFDQQGCLSPTVFFMRESGSLTIEAYAERLGVEMEKYAAANLPTELTISQANAVRSLREETAFRIANGEPMKMFTSNDTRWTVVADRVPGFPASPLNRVVFVKPLLADLPEIVAPLRESISTIGIRPSTQENAVFASALGAQRICSIGAMQTPSLTWHHDGGPVLAPLVRWVDWEYSSDAEERE